MSSVTSGDTGSSTAEQEQQVLDVDSAPEEIAEAMEFDAGSNKWTTVRTKLKVALRALSDKREDCVTVRVRDRNIDKLQVLKVRLTAAEDQAKVLDEVMRQSLAAKLSASFAKFAPPFMFPSFLSMRVYVLLQRSGVPTVRGEELTELRPTRVRISASPRSERDADVWASNKFAAFQYFSYFLSRKAYLIHSVCLSGRHFTLPVIHSWDHSMGPEDGGQDGISEWKDQLCARLGKAMGGLARKDMFSLDPSQFVNMLQERGLFGPMT
eukprot:CAMPEP_0173415882 /NCGR_PEP_ID=MMETSP1356-20130122/85100_1 /TAXON_ID=77927 ORGANISM="Hemiselmis virescens, Strain PCC157" /NCGR_SAMPLE_ID=MMETSP1356 /ASSEMBLY_ACC=CAM_ASM_000847 /LENGTH=266 /DNA_ID=CAMNT_0014378165 /DNA_START=812 /DNA_END=1609 /DNA_ORIENTATION=+